MIDRSKKLPAFFYESASGNQPVREWILALSIEDRKLWVRNLPGWAEIVDPTPELLEEPA